ncbi:AMP phosphorylase [Candidatus Bathyarchaeota archaeon A05DMB-2]|nr:AMP phosphorylase [Candidatus Bathyarchaeota archaeon A05DMB-2]
MAEVLKITAGGKRIAILSEETASQIGVHSSDRMRITHGSQTVIAIANIAAHFPTNRIGLYEEISAALGLRGDETVQVELAQLPESLSHVRAKVRGERLRGQDIVTIVKDVVERHLSEVEIAAFLTALNVYGLNMGEAEAMSRAMAETGKTLNFGEAPILDKHSIGGLPGDKTSLLVVPIIAAAGFTIPKTSSRAVTSPAGTADRVETLCPVNLSIAEIKEVVGKTNGCLVWGGALELAPADDLFIQIEYPLGIDPLLLPSIMSKKKVIGATHIVIDIPTGTGAKIRNLTEAHTLASDFVDLGKRLGITVQCALTFGDQPLGCAVGPALEAQEALITLMGDGPADLREKAVILAGMLFEMAGAEDGRQRAENMLQSGRAERKLREIIEAQGGDPNVKPEDIAVGTQKAEVTADQAGRVMWISTEGIVRVAREAGAPKEKGAGILFKAKLGEAVKKGGVLFEVYAERSSKLESALELAQRLQPVVLSKKAEERMLLDQVPEKVTREKPFMLER